MSNRLSQSQSPYLLQHAENPVDWYPWGPEALAKAKQENKPIFLSIGYSACHWCHVMKRESFESPTTANIMNELFINIKVDREERPDIDKIYMQALMLMTGQGGWPLNVWLTPDLKPFHGGTYFPHIPQQGRPSFAQMLLTLGKAWKDNRDKIDASGDELAQALHQMTDVRAIEHPGDDWLDKAVEVCELRYDDQHGGLGGAPKFPQPMALRFLLMRSMAQEDTELFEVVDHSMEIMARRGIYDQLMGGMHRYAVDQRWLVPHFEKMLSDNALICELYSEMFAYTAKPVYKWLVDTLVAWLEREMTLPNGGFASSQDAESEGEEGKYFIWTPQELATILDPSEHRLFCAFYGVNKEGNFMGHTTVLTQMTTLSRCAKDLGLDFELSVTMLGKARDKAIEHREKRVKPGRDDKALASWNAMMLSGLCKAARCVGSKTAFELAVNNAKFLKDTFCNPDPEGNYPRVCTNGVKEGIANAEDLGSMVLGFFDAYELTLDDQWFSQACQVFERLRLGFWDQSKNLTALASEKAEDLLLRPYSFEDNATPSAHSLMIECARRHHAFTGDPESKEIMEKGIEKIAGLAAQAPVGFGLALQAAHLANLAPKQLILSGDEQALANFNAAIDGGFYPDMLIAKVSTPGLNPELVEGRTGANAYLCENHTCSMPISKPKELAERLKGPVPVRG